MSASAAASGRQGLTERICIFRTYRNYSLHLIFGARDRATSKRSAQHVPGRLPRWQHARVQHAIIGMQTAGTFSVGPDAWRISCQLRPLPNRNPLSGNSDQNFTFKPSMGCFLRGMASPLTREMPSIGQGRGDLILPPPSRGTLRMCSARRSRPDSCLALPIPGHAFFEQPVLEGEVGHNLF